MRKKTNTLLNFVLVVGLAIGPKTARADFWGGDLPLLAQIVTNTLQQLYQLMQVVKTGKENYELIKEINKGINDSLNLINTISPNLDPGLYKDWQKVQDAIRGIESIYGIVIQSKEERIQKDTDQSVAEAIALNNVIYEYTKQIDDIGENIKDSSHDVSPGGAQKLTAEALGVLLHVTNQSLRTQGQVLKMQAQALAIQNYKDKTYTKQVLDTSKNLANTMKNLKVDFKLPRLE